MTEKPETKPETGDRVRLERGVRAGNPYEEAAEIVRYYLKHQNHPSVWEYMGEFEKGVAVTCENLERLMLEEAKRLNKIG
jgi:hypothetical protein